MPQYITIHRAPGLKREEVVGNAINVFNGQLAKYLHMYVNLADGFIVSVYEADSRDRLEEQFEILGFPHEEIHEVQFAQSRGEMEQMLKSMGKL